MSETEGFEDRPPTAVAAGDTDAYALVYAEQHPRLVTYARTLTRNAWQAEDLVAEAHFRVWRRLSGGHSIDNVPAYLATTVRNLAATVGAASAREIPQDPGAGIGIGQQRSTADDSAADPAQRVAYVDLLGDVLKQLPERWVRALWLAEAEDQSLEAVGRELGTNRNATAVLLSRAREGLRQAFLRAQPGSPADAACADFWDRMPAHVRDVDSPRHAAALRTHTETCEDCRSRMLLLMQANNRLPALVGPALLVLAGGGALRFLAAAGAGAGAGAGASAAAVASGKAGGAAGAGGAGAGGFAGGSFGGTAVAASVAGIAVVAAGVIVAVAVASGNSGKPTLVERAAAADKPTATASVRSAPGASPSGTTSPSASTTASSTPSAVPPALTATSVPAAMVFPSSSASGATAAPTATVTASTAPEASATATATAEPSASQPEESSEPTVTAEPTETAEPEPTASPTPSPTPSPTESSPRCRNRGSIEKHCVVPPWDRD